MANGWRSDGQKSYTGNITRYLAPFSHFRRWDHNEYPFFVH